MPLKEVMVSKPSGGRMASGSNMKSVMISERPQGGASINAEHRGGEPAALLPGKVPFYSSVSTHEHLAYTPEKRRLREHARLLSDANQKEMKSKQRDNTMKHLKHLRELEKRNAERKKLEDEEMKKKEEMKVKLKNKISRRRNAMITEQEELLSPDVQIAATDVAQAVEEPVATIATAASPPALPRKAKATATRKKKRRRHKPSTFMTKEEVVKLEEKEDDDLLDFAQKLDFEKVIEDFEVRKALEVVKEKVDTLLTKEELEGDQEEAEDEEEEEEEYDDEEEDEADDSGGRAQARAKHKKQKIERKEYKIEKAEKRRKSLPPEELQRLEAQFNEAAVPVDEEARQAREVIRKAEVLKAKQSAASVKKILQKIKEKTEREEQEEKSKDKGMEYRLRTRKEQFDHPSNLPYLHRDPAI